MQEQLKREGIKFTLYNLKKDLRTNIPYEQICDNVVHKKNKARLCIVILFCSNNIKELLIIISDIIHSITMASTRPNAFPNRNLNFNKMCMREEWSFA